MKTIRIIESCIVSGRHVDAGSVLSVSPSESALLIGCGRAVACSAPSPAVEVATVDPVAETAIAPRTAKPRRI